MAFFLSHLERERVRARVARGVERARWPKIARIYGGTQERNLSTFIEYKWPAPINRAPWSASTAPVHEFILEFFTEPRIFPSARESGEFLSIRIEEEEKEEGEEISF